MKPHNKMYKPCMVCFAEGTETMVAFHGNAAWLVAGLVFMGVPEDEADNTLRHIWQTTRGRFGSGLKAVATKQEKGLGPLPVGSHRMYFSVCIRCAESHNVQWGVDESVPCYTQPEIANEVN